MGLSRLCDAGKSAREIRAGVVKRQGVWYCCFSIGDSGCGISAEKGRLIFVPYFYYANSAAGLGFPIAGRVIVAAEDLGIIFFQ